MSDLIDRSEYDADADDDGSAPSGACVKGGRKRIGAWIVRSACKHAGAPFLP